MATLQELYDEVDANADTIKRIVGDSTDTQVGVTILYKSGSVGMSLRRWIFVKDKGLGTEKAYWDSGKPSYLTAADSFPGDLATELTTYQTANPAFEKYSITETNATSKYAIVKAWVKTSETQSIVKNYIFWKQGANWTVREII
jgi:hypothetical protein